MRFSAVVAVRDEEAMIEGALRTLTFCDEIIVVVDDRTRDRTADIARRYTEHVHIVPFTGFGALKNAGVERARGEWIVFCDGDERVTPALARELVNVVDGGTEYVAFRAPRVNFFWGQRMEHGAWPESHLAIARRDHARHVGDIHERLQIAPGQIGTLSGERWHFTHRSIEENLLKTANYSRIEAAERLASGVPPVTAWTLIRVVALEFARRMIRRSGWRDGTPGVIEGLYQPFSVLCSWAMVWERQQGDRIHRAYAELEQAVQRQV